MPPGGVWAPVLSEIKPFSPRSGQSWEQSALLPRPFPAGLSLQLPLPASEAGWALHRLPLEAARPPTLRGGKKESDRIIPRVLLGSCGGGRREAGNEAPPLRVQARMLKGSGGHGWVGGRTRTEVGRG